MRLLIFTQVLDINHPILGFFHRWVEEFARHCEHVHVVALQVGTYTLPNNVTVHSLGKENRRGRVVYLWRFYRYSWKLRHEYDGVFVHMNQIYVILGGVLWRALKKPIGLWYAHGAVSPSLRLATNITSMVFTSTSQGFQLDSSKKLLVGQGIDMNRFAYHKRQAHNSVLELITVGRISMSKQIETLLQACVLLKQRGLSFRLRIVGTAVTDVDHVYEQTLKSFCEKELIADYIIWHGPATQVELPPLLAKADIFIHDGTTNSLDKVLVEAVVSGVPTISSNPSYRYMIGEDVKIPIYYQSGNAQMLASHIQTISEMSLVDKNIFTHAIAEKVRSEHGLPKLISGIVARY